MFAVWRNEAQGGADVLGALVGIAVWLLAFWILPWVDDHAG